MHSGVETWEKWWLKGQGPALASERLHAAGLAMQQHQYTVNPFDYHAALSLMAGYHARWEDHGARPLAVEKRFHLPLINPDTQHASRTWELGGVWDGLVRWEGQLYVKETKTSSEDIRPGSDYWRRLRMDSQVSTYYAAARLAGHSPVGVLYDVIKKPTQRPYKVTPKEDRKFTQGKKCKVCKGAGLVPGTTDGCSAGCTACSTTGFAEPPHLYANQREEAETPAEYGARVSKAVLDEPERWFQRGIVIRLAADELAHERDYWQLAKQMREDKAHVRNPDSCVQWSRTCDYFDVCTNSASIDDDNLFRTRNKQHPELEEASEHSEQSDKRSA